MVEWHHRLKGHAFEQTPGDSEGLGSPILRILTLKFLPFALIRSVVSHQVYNRKSVICSNSHSIVGAPDLRKMAIFRFKQAF